MTLDGKFDNQDLFMAAATIPLVLGMFLGVPAMLAASHSELQREIARSMIPLCWFMIGCEAAYWLLWIVLRWMHRQWPGAPTK